MKLKITTLTPQEKKGIDKIYYSTFKTNFGKFVVASTNTAICNILLFKNLSETIKELQTCWPSATVTAKAAPAHTVVKKLFSGKKINSSITLALRGTKFQTSVWKALLDIPKGKTSTYTKIATQIGKPKAVRAVGTAIGNNPMCYLIPCHRVLNSNGGIGGYRWGTNVKKKMLALEGVTI